MEITRDVIIDILPLYLAGEVSAGTRVLVEKYLESDPELANLAKQPATSRLLEEVPVPLSKEDAMQAYQEARRWMVIRTLGLAAVIAVVFLCTLSVVLGSAIFYLK